MFDHLPSVASLVQAHDLRTNKKLGQHFLLDGNLTDKVAAYAGKMDKTNVIEIGPGPGSLTRSLLKCTPLTLTAIEKDARCVSLLEPLIAASGETLRIKQMDALTVDLTEEIPFPRIIVANLPYNIATPLLIGWLKSIHAKGGQAFCSLTLMFQKEVADRIRATPSTSLYGRLSVMTQWLCATQHCMHIPPGAFSPPPKVMSSVIRLIPVTTPPSLPWEAMECVVKAAFNQRRKMLRASLKSLDVNAAALLDNAAIDGTRRAEELSVEEFTHLASCYQALV